LLSEVPYGTFANYSPRGTSTLSRESQSICGGIKAGKERLIRSAFPHLGTPAAAILEPFLNPTVTLIPVPRSAPLTPGALWPARVIADLLVEGGFGHEVLPCIERVTAVPKSAVSQAKERPLWHAHHASLTVRGQLLVPSHITLIDDVLTMGRTTFACAQRLHEAFPAAELRVFAMIRTLGLVDDIDAIIEPAVGTISGYASGKTFRDP
jgi:hypothetical protein